MSLFPPPGPTRFALATGVMTISLLAFWYFVFFRIDTSPLLRAVKEDSKQIQLNYPDPASMKLSLNSGATVIGLLLRSRNVQYNLPSHLYRTPHGTSRDDLLATRFMTNKYNKQRDEYSSALSRALPFNSQILTIPIEPLSTNCTVDQSEPHAITAERRIAYQFKSLHDSAWRYYLSNYTGTDDDILVVIEDGSMLTVDSVELTVLLSQELNNMQTHYLYLGWCLQVHSKASSCEYAYAVRRSAIPKLISLIDLCSRFSLTHQLHSIFHHKQLTFARSKTNSCWYISKSMQPL